MDGNTKTNRLLHLGLRRLHLGRPLARVESQGAGVQARAVNLVVYGHQRARAGSLEATIMVKESPHYVLFCRMLLHVHMKTCKPHILTEVTLTSLLLHKR